MTIAICAQTEEAEGTFCHAQGNFPATRQPLGGRGDQDHPSQAPGLGELFPDRAFESMFLDDSSLGRSEDPASSDAVSVTQSQGLETVE
jgi:hypothetical protein